MATPANHVKLHLVGGFLGGGKTTAIAGAARVLVGRGQSVGIITNDQGKLLVDTSFFKFLGLPTVAVVGGCFCCNYRDLLASLRQLCDKSSAGIVFAEAVGSCADMVATVVKPLQQLERGKVTLASFTVFVDIRLLRLRVLGRPMPFSDDIQYIFEKQLEEAGLIVVSHADEVAPEIARETESLARELYPDATLRLQNSLDSESVAGWVDLITGGRVPLPGRSVEIDYERYGAGEADLAWLDERIALTFPEGGGRAAVTRLLGEIARAFQREQWPVGHFKCAIESEADPAKISICETAADWRDAVPELAGTEVTLILNARVQAGAGRLREVVNEAVRSVNGIATQTAAFHPGFPTPTHRLG